MISLLVYLLRQIRKKKKKKTKKQQLASKTFKKDKHTQSLRLSIENS